MVYEVNAKLYIKIDTPSWRHSRFNAEENKAVLRRANKLMNKTRDVAHIQEFSAKKRAAKSYNSKVVWRKMQEGDLMLR